MNNIFEWQEKEHSCWKLTRCFIINHRTLNFMQNSESISTKVQSNASSSGKLQPDKDRKKNSYLFHFVFHGWFGAVAHYPTSLSQKAISPTFLLQLQKTFLFHPQTLFFDPICLFLSLVPYFPFFLLSLKFCFLLLWSYSKPLRLSHAGHYSSHLILQRWKKQL